MRGVQRCTRPTSGRGLGLAGRQKRRCPSAVGQSWDTRGCRMPSAHPGAETLLLWVVLETLGPAAL